MDKPVFQFEPLPGARLGVGEYSFSYTYTETREVGSVGHTDMTHTHSWFGPCSCLSVWVARRSSFLIMFSLRACQWSAGDQECHRGVGAGAAEA